LPLLIFIDLLILLHYFHIDYLHYCHIDYAIDIDAIITLEPLFISIRAITAIYAITPRRADFS